MHRDDFMGVALQIGERLVRSALWERDSCTWQLPPVMDWNHTERPGGLAGHSLYVGTAGIALFLSELFRVTNDAAWLKTATGALQYSRDELAKLNPRLTGFYVGTTGVAYAHARMASITRDQRFADTAFAILDDVEPHIDTSALDFLSGAASGCLALLWTGTELQCPQYSDWAVRLAAHITAHARHHRIGWSWPDEHGGAVQDLAGLAHGASGFILSLSRMWRVTGDGALRYAAAQAASYEDQLFIPEQGNWLDRRDDQLYRYQSRATPPTWQELLADSQRPRLNPRFMAGWCHGAPGIALARQEAAECIGELTGAELIETAIRTTAGSCLQPDVLDNVCHGTIGNLGILAHLAADRGDSSLLEWARRRMLSVAHTRLQAGERWRTDGVRHRSPTLFTGEAGIGYLFLAHAVENVPCLLTVPTVATRTAAETGCGYLSAQQQHVETFFRDSLCTLSQAARAACRKAAVEAPGGRAVVGTYEWLGSFAREETESVSGHGVAAILAADRAYFEAGLQPLDLITPRLRDMCTAALRGSGHHHAVIVLDESVRIIAERRARHARASQNVHVVWTSAAGLQRAWLTPLAMALLQCAEVPAARADYFAAVLARLSSDNAYSVVQIESAIRAQADQLLDAGLLRLRPGEAEPSPP